MSRRTAEPQKFFDEAFGDIKLDGKIDRAGAEGKWILAAAGAQPPRASSMSDRPRTLDLGCGRGRTVIGFAERGARAWGLDVNPEYIATARDRARDRGLDCRFLVADMRSLDAYPELGNLDIVTSLFTSFGYFDDDINARLLADVHSLLRAGGTFALETQNVESAEVRREQQTDLERLGDTTLSKSATYHPADGRKTFRHVVWGNNGTSRIAELVVRLYSRRELTELTRAAGFGAVAFYGRLDGRPFHPDGEKLVMLARRGDDA